MTTHPCPSFFGLFHLRDERSFFFFFIIIFFFPWQSSSYLISMSARQTHTHTKKGPFFLNIMDIVFCFEYFCNQLTSNSEDDGA